MSDDFDELVATPPRRQRVPRTIDPMKAKIRLAAHGHTDIKSTDFIRPVTQQFMAEVFGMDPATVKKRLVTCPTLDDGTGARRVYDFKTACEYLIKPKMDEATFIKTLNHADMPKMVNKVFWEAKRIKLKYEIEAGEAWATSDVLEVFGDVFMTVKSHAQLWVEAMREIGLDDVAAKKVEQLTDAFSAELHSKLVEMPKQRQTRSRIAELEQELMASEGGGFDDDD